MRNTVTLLFAAAALAIPLGLQEDNVRNRLFFSVNRSPSAPYSNSIPQIYTLAGDGKTLTEIVPPNAAYNPVYNYGSLNIDRHLQRLYFTINTINFQNQNVRNRIVSVDYQGQQQTTIFDENWDSILGLVVDPREGGLMYFSGWHTHNALYTCPKTACTSPLLLHNFTDPYIVGIRQIELWTTDTASTLYFNAAYKSPGTDFHGTIFSVDLGNPGRPERKVYEGNDVWGDFQLTSQGFYYFTLTSSSYVLQLLFYDFSGKTLVIDPKFQTAPGGMTLSVLGTMLYWTTGSGGPSSSTLAQTDLRTNATTTILSIPCGASNNCWGASIVAAPDPQPRCCVYQYQGCPAAPACHFVSPFCVPTTECPTISPEWSFRTSFRVLNCSDCHFDAIP